MNYFGSKIYFQWKLKPFHLHLDHGLTDPDAFDKHIKFGILDIVNPTEIEKKEFCWMHKINSFQPVGINIEYPFGIPFLGQN